MKRILSLIEKRQETLSHGKLFRWLADENTDGYERLRFAPAVLYYLMGFKDVLGALYRHDPKSELDHFINAYCGEDAEHWRWFLRDLERLGCSLSTWGSNVPDFCNEVWSPETEINRKTIFSLVGHSDRCAEPLKALALIMVFEATGVVFIGHTRRAAKAIGMDDTLLYFGRVHYEEEFAHSVQSKDLAKYILDAKTYAEAEAMVHELFDLYEKLFDCWYEHRERYVLARPSSESKLAKSKLPSPQAMVSSGSL